MKNQMQAKVSVDLGRGNETYLGFVLNRHKEVVLNDAGEEIVLTLSSSVDPEDLFLARFEDLKADLSYYGFGVGDGEIQVGLDA